ncbi:Ras guanine nucleotide exchange factor bud5 [Rhodotorula kratochvilovae]
MSTSPLTSSRLSSPVDPQEPAFFFVKALHSFSSQQAASCLSFSAGQIIKCFNRDASGWWDGECEGRRGWFPSNYTEVVEEDGQSFTSPALSPDATTLLSSIDHNVRLLDNAVRARRKAHYQPSTACVISSIRTVLSATSALTRDSLVLRQHPSLSSSRKRILSSLAALVNQARKASAPAPPNPPPGQDEADAREADEMLSIALETLDSVRAFLRAAEDKGVRVDLALGSSAPVGVSASGSSAAEPEGGEQATPPLRPAKSMGNLLSQRRPTLAVLNEPMASSTFPVRGPPPTSPSSATSPVSSTTPSPSSDSAQITLRSPSALSLHLSTLHDSLLSTIAALIGHVHSHARSSSPASSFAQLIDLTREGIERVRDVLVVVERVAARVLAGGNVPRDGDEMKVLAATREKLYEATTALVAAARIATSPRVAGDAPPRPRKRSTDSSASAELGREKKRAEREQDDEERKTLLGAATGVLRAGGDCVGAVKLVVQQLAGSGAHLELTLPRPKTVEELTAMEQAADEGAAAPRPEEPHEDAADSSSAGGSLKFADAEEELPSPTSSLPSVSAAAEERAIPRPGVDGDSPRKRNPHTLSMLGRKANSLGCLRGRYEADTGAGAMGGLTLEEDDEEEPEDDRRDEDRESACTGDSEQTASSPVLPRPSSFARSVSPVKGYSRSIKTSSISLSPAYRAASPSPSTSSAAEHPRRPSSSAMHRAQSNESAHSASSSRATAISVASSSALTTHTAETSPRSSMQNPAASIAAAMLKAAPRSSLGSVSEAPATAPPVPAAPSPNATPRGSVSAASSSGVAWFLQRDYLPREISFNADGHVSGGTLRCLVERMTLHDTTIDAAFSNTFLLTFRMFTTPLELARLLWARFDLAPPRNPDTGAELAVDEMKMWTAQKLTPIRLRIYNLFKTWVESFWLHAHDREIVDGLLEWCAGRLKAAMPSASTRLADLVQKRVAAAQQEQAQRDSSDEFGVRHHSNNSSASLASGSVSPSMNGSTLSLTTSNTTPASSIRSGLTGGGLLHRMQSTDKLKAGKTLVPFSSLSSGSSTAQDAYSPSSAAAASAPPPLITKSLLAALRPTLAGRTPLLSSVTELDPLELARQLTIMEARVYGAIRADELLGAGNGAAGGKSGAEAARVAEATNVRKMSALSTRLTGWITETILGEQDQKRRTSLVKFFIKLGDRLLSLANYNALFAVFTALNSSTITRLRKTWDGLAPKYRAIFETLRKATDHGRNYAEYRQKIRQAVPPCLPFVGLFLTDLIFVFEGNRAERPSPADPSLLLINFDRYHKMARIVGELQRFQAPYALVGVPELQAYLSQELEGLKRGQDAQTLYRQSLMIEPRMGSGPSSSAASIISSHDSHRPTRDIFNWRG